MDEDLEWNGHLEYSTSSGGMGFHNHGADNTNETTFKKQLTVHACFGREVEDEQSEGGFYIRAKA